jgi:hypothetical protein
VLHQKIIDTINYVSTTKGYSLSFVIKDGSNLLVGAKVTLDGYGELTSNTLGKLTFTNVSANQTLSFIVKSAGYADSIGSIHFNAKDTTITIQSQSKGYTVVFVIKNSLGVIPDAKVTLVGYGDKISDAMGMVTFSNVKPQDMVAFGIKAQGYIDSVATFTMTSANGMKTIILKEIPMASDIVVLEKMIVYPNPCTNQITVLEPSKSYRIVITNSKGIMMVELLSNGNQVVNTSTLPAGIYYITRFALDGESITQTIIKE